MQRRSWRDNLWLVPFGCYIVFVHYVRPGWLGELVGLVLFAVLGFVFVSRNLRLKLKGNA